MSDEPEAPSPAQRGFVARAFSELAGGLGPEEPELHLKACESPAAKADLFRLRQTLHRTMQEVHFLIVLLSVAPSSEVSARYVARIRGLLASFPWEQLDEGEPPRPWLAREGGGGKGEKEEPDEADRRALESYVTGLIKKHWSSLWARGVDFLLKLLRRNLLTTVAAAFFAAVLLFVEPVGTLYAEEPGDTLGMTAVVIFGPFLLNALLSRIGTKSRIALLHRMAGWLRASYRISFDHRVRREEGWRIPERLRDDAPILFFGVFLRAGIRLGVALLAALVLASFGDETAPTRTVGVSLSVASAALSLLHAIDFTGWVFPYRSRGILLLMSLLGFAYYLWANPAGGPLLWTSIALVVAAVAYLIAGLVLLRRSKKEEAPKTNLAHFLVQRGPPLLIALAGLITLAVLIRTRQAERWCDRRAHGPRVMVEANEWPRDRGHPVIVVAASGGGSRAAYYTARTLLLIETLRSERGSEEEEGRSLGEDLQLISSVSGGSLASAAYLSQRLAHPGLSEVQREHREEALLRILERNYMWPVLRGALHPSVSRGESVEEAWTEAFGRRVTLGDLAERWSADPEALPFPMPIFNAASLRGHRVCLSPLRWAAYGDDRSRLAMDERTNAYGRPREPAITDPTWVYHRTGAYGLEHLLVRYDPRLPELVRASANFPFGFPPVEVETDRPLFYSPDREERRAGPSRIVQLTDGGAISNSGLWPLFDLLVQKEEALRELGVLLVIVDTTRMPVRRTGQAATVLDQRILGRQMHRLMIAELRARYRGRLGVVEIDLPADRSHNVYTSWALDRDAKERLRDAFGRGQEAWSEELLGIYELLFAALHSPSDEPESPERGGSPEELERRMAAVDRMEERVPMD